MYSCALCDFTVDDWRTLGQHLFYCWDLRLLNDINTSDELRTRHLLPVLRIYDNDE